MRQGGTGAKIQDVLARPSDTVQTQFARLEICCEQMFLSALVMIVASILIFVEHQ
jgi:hypothetical protein